MRTQLYRAKKVSSTSSARNSEISYKHNVLGENDTAHDSRTVVSHASSTPPTNKQDTNYKNKITIFFLIAIRERGCGDIRTNFSKRRHLIQTYDTTI